MKIIERVSHFISTLELEQVPSSVILEAKKAMADCIGVSIAAAREPCLSILRPLIQRMGGEPRSTLWGTAIRTSPSWAALYNGTMAHALDFDDGGGLHIPLHPSVPVLPAVIALGEFIGANGKRVLEAYICGVEVECALARGCSRASYDSGWHATGVFGTMGAAAGSAKLLGLGAGQASDALGIALSQVGGSRQNFGTMVKPLHAGRAAMNGILSALLAQDGFTASDGALDGPLGFGKLFDGKNLAEECGTLGKSYYFAKGVSIKKYPSCHATHPGIDAVLELVKNHPIDYRDIKGITCWSHPSQVSGLPYALPKTPLEAKFSMQFLLALACVYGKVELKHFRDDVLKDERVIDLCRKVGFLAENDIVGSRVTIELSNNKTYTAAVDKPRGHPKYPLSVEEVKDKFRSCAGVLLPGNEAEEVLGAIFEMDKLRDINSITNAFRREFA
ncbi:MAG: MmgE/PrpD family protein [Thermodesulfobacteriota bacterium]